MKLILLLLVSQVHAQTLWTDSLYYFVQIPAVREGAFAVLFDDTQAGSNPYNSCWLAFTGMNDFFDKLPAVNSLLDLTRTFTSFKRYMEYGVLVFDFYWSCGLNTVNAELGQRASSAAGLTDLAISSYYSYLEDCGDEAWQADMIQRIDNANNAGTRAAWQEVGQPLGALMADFLYY